MNLYRYLLLLKECMSSDHTNFDIYGGHEKLEIGTFLFLFKMAEICRGVYNLGSGKQLLAIKV